MDLFKTIFKRTKSHKSDNTRELGRHLDSFPTFLGDGDVYENVYASVRPIVNRFTDIEPYAMNIKGDKVESSTVDALYTPNDKMGFTQFLDAIAVGVLTQPEVNILVWRKHGRRVLPGGNITKDNVAGYTFINRWTVDLYGKRIYERQTDAGVETFTDSEVITLVHSRNPHDLNKGYSPAAAARRWANIDDLIADYQAGYFINSAVPAGMFIITAPTAKEYEDIVRGIRERHQGASKNNNVVFSHAPLDPTTGKPAQASITWVPFNVTNKDLELGVLFDNTNKKIDSSFAVPAVMRGVDSNSTYSNANVSKREFVEGVIKPFTKNIWSQWTHEMNRITGGIEAVIKFDLVIPAVVDEDKVIEETKKIRDDRIMLYLNLGYTIESIKNYLDTDDITSLESAPVVEPEEPQVVVDVTDLAEQGDETPTVIYRSVEAELHCKECDRFLGNTKQLEYTDKLKCANSKCKALEVPVIKEAANADTLKVVSEEQADTLEAGIADVARELMQVEIDRAIDELDDTKATQEEIDEFAAKMMIAITAVLLVYGEEGYAVGAGLAGAALSNLDGFTLPQATTDAYREYLHRVGASYGRDNAEAIQKVLLNARDNGLTRRETEEALKQIINTDDWRIKRLARTELNHSQQIGKLEGFKEIRDEVGGRWEKTLSHANVSGICPLCASQEGIWTGLDDPTWRLGDSIATFNEEGEQVIYVNDWQTNDGWGLHPNCKGSLITRRIAE